MNLVLSYAISLIFTTILCGSLAGVLFIVTGDPSVILRPGELIEHAPDFMVFGIMFVGLATTTYGLFVHNFLRIIGAANLAWLSLAGAIGGFLMLVYLGFPKDLVLTVYSLGIGITSSIFFQFIFRKCAEGS